jgi:hypothetical protein
MPPASHQVSATSLKFSRRTVTINIRVFSTRTSAAARGLRKPRLRYFLISAVLRVAVLRRSFLSRPLQLPGTSPDSLWPTALWFVVFACKFKYLARALHFFLSSDVEMNTRTKSATSIFGALCNSGLYNKSVCFEVKGRVYVALELRILLQSSESLSFFADLFLQLGSFQNFACRSTWLIQYATTSNLKLSASALASTPPTAPFTAGSLRRYRDESILAKLQL